MMQTVKELCEEAIRNGDFTLHYHAKWGNPAYGVYEQDHYLTGNYPITTDKGRRRNNAVLRITKAKKPNWYDVEVWAYSTCIANILLDAVSEEAHILDCSVTSRTDITILRNVADLFGWKGVASIIRNGNGWKYAGPMTYSDFRDSAKYLHKYDLTPYC